MYSSEKSGYRKRGGNRCNSTSAAESGAIPPGWATFALKGYIANSLFTKSMSKKSSGAAARHSLIIRSKVMSSRILDISSDSLTMEMNENGTIAGKYTGTQLATVVGTIDQYGSSSWQGKFMHMTNKGDMVVAIGHGTSKPSSKKGIAIIGGEGVMWTRSQTLSNLNGAKWKCEGESNMIKGSSLIYVDF